MKKGFVLFAALALSSTVTMRAQSVKTPGWIVAPADQSGWLFQPLHGQVVKGAPYSAEVVSEMVQTLGDGNRIVQRTTGRIYRDSAGRVRREEDQPTGDPVVTISDPVLGKSFTINAANKTFRQSPLLGVQWLPVKNKAIAGTPGWDYFNYMSPLGYTLNRRIARVNSDVTNTETLPNRTIEGVTASGVRKTTTIAAGAIGNERPIQIVLEEWTSADLQVLVLTDLNDPRAGRSTYKLLKINRAEPDPALFRVPGGFSAEIVPPGGRGGDQPR